MEQEQHGSCRAVVTTSRKPHAASEALARQTAAQQIGRASCRERVCLYV